jgi:hypothetical protein
MNNTDKRLLVLNLIPELEDALVDYLLSHAEVRGFTSFPVRGHGDQEALTVAEQVRGQRKRLQFELMLDAEAIDPLLAGLADEVGKGIVYHVQPILQKGRI